MRSSLLFTTLAVAGLLGGVAAHAADHGHVDKSARAALEKAVAGPQRTDTNRARDQYRHPVETLAFFGVKPTDTVAPYLADKGKLIAVAPAGKGAEGMAKRFDAPPELFGKVERANFPVVLGGTGVAPGTADVVLTFRNVHNWKMGYLHPDKTDYSEAAFEELFAMLKPGGVLGIVDHRAPEAADAERERKSGYINVATVRALAEKAGFRFDGASEVNANAKDTADWPQGVWTLPPTLALGEQDKAKYLGIGESDRMTLRFVKPKG